MDEQNHREKLKISVDFSNEAVALVTRLAAAVKSGHGEVSYLIISSDVPDNSPSLPQLCHHLFTLSIPVQKNQTAHAVMSRGQRFNTYGTRGSFLPCTTSSGRFMRCTAEEKSWSLSLNFKFATINETRKMLLIMSTIIEWRYLLQELPHFSISLVAIHVAMCQSNAKRNKEFFKMKALTRRGEGLSDMIRYW